MSSTTSKRRGKAATSGRINKALFGTTVTAKHLEEKLAQALGTRAHFGSNFKVKRLGIGQGFLSAIARVYPEWTSEADSLPRSVIVKIPTIKTSQQVMNDNKVSGALETSELGKDSVYNMLQNMLTKTHNNEVIFYEYTRNHEISKKISKIYYSKKLSDECHEGLIIMEDRGEECTATAPYDVLSLDEAMQLLDLLAEMHCYSIVHKDVLEITDFAYSDLLVETGHTEMFPRLLKYLSDLDKEKLGPLLDRIAPFGQQLYDGNLLRRVQKKMELPTVLVHGDFWAANFLWQQCGPLRKLETVVDWQIMHPGCIAEDIARFMTCCLTSAGRRAHSLDLLKYYHEQLCGNLGETPFTFEQLIRHVKQLYPFELGITLPFFGPIFIRQIELEHPEQKEVLIAVMKEKAIGLSEDFLELMDAK